MNSFNTVSTQSTESTDKKTISIILRAMVLYEFLESGWTIKKLTKNKFEVVKTIKK